MEPLVSNPDLQWPNEMMRYGAQILSVQIDTLFELLRKGGVARRPTLLSEIPLSDAEMRRILACALIVMKEKDLDRLIETLGCNVRVLRAKLQFFPVHGA
jgi:hypothetical protein